MGSYDMTIGTLLVGIFFNTFLYGLVTYQFAAYCRSKFNDRPAVKYMVLFLFVLDTFHSISVVYMAWYYVVANYGNPATLKAAAWPYVFTPGGTALVAFVTQIYLGFRIWSLSDSKILYCVVITLAIPSFILGMMCCIEAWTIKIISELPRITPLVITWLSLQVVTDTFISVTLVVLFSRSRTGFRRMDTVLNRLIRGTIQTGLFAGIFSLGDLVSFVILPNTNLHGMFAIPIGRIYTNTLLDTLLTRELLREELNGTYGLRGTINTVCWTSADPSQASTSMPSTSIQLKLQDTVKDCGHSSAEGAEVQPNLEV